MSRDTPSATIGKLRIAIDCHDPERLALFWGAVLGVEIDERLGNPPQYVDLAPRPPDGLEVDFQRVPEPKVAKNRLHFDLDVDDVDAATAWIEELGGRRLPHNDYHEYGYSWRLMADPEGNEFCLIYGFE
ncbi:MAG: VOC family protein [Candidatus Dormibacteraeota bacterium]|nr:VOC family protein [Candidatus Dormibacteraeota bacterium]MDQ6884177.1 VOC family protein [Candidatus Dormibacteraeota bacterium]